MNALALMCAGLVPLPNGVVANLKPNEFERTPTDERRARILEALESGPMIQSELAKLVGVPKSTISVDMTALLDAGKVRSKMVRIPNGIRKAAQYALPWSAQ